MNIEKRVAELVDEKIAEINRPDVFLVSAKLHSNGKLIILIDGDKGVGIDECVQISRYVGFKLEEEDVIKTAYNLEVSSPGIDTPLVQPRQYTKNIGRNLSIKMADGSKREGTLRDATEDAVIIEEKIKEKGKKAEIVESTIPLEQISETKVLISFK
ncbi:ribosome assembly cofactor RimP [Mucilaginibacter panaciglaebae]|uniref:Ribosome maturation factor RimP n=1 Tax=Mucilaginibacter panaciglaebae TaxID=502331 RepID=A0ABP7WS02_9SPHI